MMEQKCSIVKGASVRKQTLKKLIFGNFWLVLFAVALFFSCSNVEVDPVSQTPDDAAAEAKFDMQGEGGGKQIPFDDAEVFFEWNFTDNDLGLQIFLDAEGWDNVSVAAPPPDREEIVQIITAGSLSELGITELRFESAEPSPEEVLALFPPGKYKFSGETVEGDRLVGAGKLSHDFLNPPTFSPSDGEEVDPKNTVVTWEALSPEPESVEVIIENEETGEVFDVTVSGSKTSLDVPPQFLEAGMEYKIEILAIHKNGNRSIAESTFETE
jgi:hypothetical protein